MANEAERRATHKFEAVRRIEWTMVHSGRHNASSNEMERQLLDNVLDALDRLHDRQSSALDIQALAQATGAAVSDPDMAWEPLRTFACD